MKKTFTINISGIIFNIDEDAYKKLQDYLSSIKQHFRNMEGKEEIINDIENRIAEILQQKINDKKQVIVVQDIDEVIDIMGQPSQFEEDSDIDDQDDVFEPEAKPYKRLLRDGENKWVGGVASGIAAYFHIDPIWIRLLFFVSIFVGGTGLIVYVILWIALPEAKTTAEKLEMKGEKVNITNIEKSIREEIDQLSDKLNNLKDQAKGKYKKKGETGKTIFENILGIFVDVLKIFLRIILILLGIVFILTAISVIIGLFSALFGWGGFMFVEGFDAVPYSFPVFFEVLLGPDFNLTLLRLGLILFIGIPFLMLLYNGVRLIFGLDGIKYLGITALNLWIIGVVMTAYFSIKSYNHFKYESYEEEIVVLEENFADTLYLELDNSFFKDDGYINDYFIIGDAGVMFMENGDFNCIPHLRVRKSDDKMFSMEFRKYARGKNRQLALERAEDIDYNFNLTDTSIVFQPFFTFPDYESWHGEQLDIILYVPENTTVTFGKYMWRITEQYDHNSYSDYRRHHRSNKSWSRKFAENLIPERYFPLHHIFIGN